MSRKTLALAHFFNLFCLYHTKENNMNNLGISRVEVGQKSRNNQTHISNNICHIISKQAALNIDLDNCFYTLPEFNELVF